MSHLMQTFSQPPNRTLVVIMGNLRGGERAWETLQRNVLDPSMADLALIIGQLDEEELNDPLVNLKPSLIDRSKFIWYFQEYKDWGYAVDLISGTAWRENLLKLVHPANGPFGGVEGQDGSGAIIMMIRWFLTNHIIDFGLTKKYDKFVITRSDHYYQCLHNVSEFPVGNKQVWIPPGSDYFGYTDRHLIVGNDDVLDALDIFPTFFRGELERPDRKLNPEKLIKQVWEKKGLKVNHFNRTMFTCALKTDTTRWRRASSPVPNVPCLRMKYINEYEMVQHNCPPIAPPNPSFTTTSTKTVETVDCKERYRSKAMRRKCYTLQDAKRKRAKLERTLGLTC